MSQLTHEQAMRGLKRAIELAKATDSKPASPESIDEILDRAFLSPRIVNERTCEDWTSRLKDMLESAREERSGLRDDLAALKDMASAIQASDAELTRKIDLASKAVPAIESRMSRAEQALSTAARNAADQVNRLELATDRRFELDRERIEGLIESIARVVMDKLAATALTAHEQKISESCKSAETRLHEILRSTMDESSRIQARAAQSISRELTKIDRAKEDAREEFNAIVSGEFARLRAEAVEMTAKAEAAGAQAAVFSRGAIAGAESAISCARAAIETRVEELRGMIDGRSSILETQIAEFTRFVSEHSHSFETDREAISAMIMEHSSRLSEQINQFATEASSGSERLTRERAEAIDMVRKRADVEFRHVSAMLAEREGRVERAADDAIRAIEAARSSACEALKAAGDRSGGEIGERLRAEAEALTAGMRQAGAQLRELREETTTSLTKAAIAIGGLTQESKETIRNCARVAAEKASESIAAESKTNMTLMKETCEEAQVAKTELSAAIDRATSFDSATLEVAASDAQQASARALHAAGLLNGAIARAESLRAEVDTAMRELMELRRQSETMRKRESKSRD